MVQIIKNIEQGFNNRFGNNDERTECARALSAKASKSAVHALFAFIGIVVFARDCGVI